MKFSAYLHFKFYKMINVVWFSFKNWYLPRKQKKCEINWHRFLKGLVSIDFDEMLYVEL